MTRGMVVTNFEPQSLTASRRLCPTGFNTFISPKVGSFVLGPYYCHQTIREVVTPQQAISSHRSIVILDSGCAFPPTSTNPGGSHHPQLHRLGSCAGTQMGDHGNVWGYLSQDQVFGSVFLRSSHVFSDSKGRVSFSFGLPYPGKQLLLLTVSDLWKPGPAWRLQHLMKWPWDDCN